MIGRWWTWLRQLGRPEPVPPSPPLDRAVLGVMAPVPPVTVPPQGDGTLRFRGHRWLQVGTADSHGLLTFVREVAVDGRAVQSELRVHAADLTLDGTTYTLNGRD